MSVVLTSLIILTLPFLDVCSPPTRRLSGKEWSPYSDGDWKTRFPKSDPSEFYWDDNMFIMTRAKESELRKGNKLPPQPESGESCSSGSSESSSGTGSSHTIERGAIPDADSNMTSDHDDYGKRLATAAHPQDDPVNKKTPTRSAGARIGSAPRKTFLEVAGKTNRPAASGSVPDRDDLPSDAKDASNESMKTAKSDDQCEPIPHDQFRSVDSKFDKRMGQVLWSLSSRDFAAVEPAVANQDDDISSLSSNYNTTQTGLGVATKVECCKQRQLANDSTSIGESATTESPPSKEPETKEPTCTNTTPTGVRTDNKLTSPAADLPHKPSGEKPQASDVTNLPSSATSPPSVKDPSPAANLPHKPPGERPQASEVANLPSSATSPPSVEDRHQARNNSVGMDARPGKKARYSRRKSSSELDSSSGVGSYTSGYAPDEECTPAQADIMRLRATEVSRHSRNKGSKNAKALKFRSRHRHIS